MANAIRPGDWLETVAEPCELAAWDSNFFGFTVARVCGETLSPHKLIAVDAWCARRGVQLLYFLARPDDPATAALAGAGGFLLTDVRNTYHRDLTAGDAGVAPTEGMADQRGVRAGDAGVVPTGRMADQRGVRAGDAGVAPTGGMAEGYDLKTDNSIRLAVPEDLIGLERMTPGLFCDSRFYHDPRIPAEKADALFVQWVGGSLDAAYSAMFVAPKRDTGIAGFVSCERRPDAPWASIGLLGVAPTERGRGIGRDLVAAAVQWATGSGATGVDVVTQARNLASQRLYQRCGFVTRKVGLYYHKWYGADASRDGRT